MSLGPLYEGAHTVDGPMTVVDVWQLLHSDAKEWESVPRNSNFFKIRDMLDSTDREALAKLSVFHASLWEHLCFGAGWTAIGVVALSWCRDADLKDVARIWKSLTPQITPESHTLRTASLMSPKILPASNKLSDITAALEGAPFDISVVMAAHQGAIKIDMDRKVVLDAPSIMIPMLVYAIGKNPANASYANLTEPLQAKLKSAAPRQD